MTGVVWQMKAYQDNSPEKVAKNEAMIRTVKVRTVGMGMPTGLAPSSTFTFIHMHVCVCWLHPSVCLQASVNRWTDNIWLCQSYVKKKFNVVGKDFWVNLDGISEEIDYV